MTVRYIAVIARATVRIWSSSGILTHTRKMIACETGAWSDTGIVQTTPQIEEQLKATTSSKGGGRGKSSTVGDCVRVKRPRWTALARSIFVFILTRRARRSVGAG